MGGTGRSWLSASELVPRDRSDIEDSIIAVVEADPYYRNRKWQETEVPEAMVFG